jgi:hypothetical protein
VEDPKDFASWWSNLLPTAKLKKGDSCIGSPPSS